VIATLGGLKLDALEHHLQVLREGSASAPTIFGWPPAAARAWFRCRSFRERRRDGDLLQLCGERCDLSDALLAWLVDQLFRPRFEYTSKKPPELSIERNQLRAQLGVVALELLIPLDQPFDLFIRESRPLRFVGHAARTSDQRLGDAVVR
jgi:hypothetical protein